MAMDSVSYFLNQIHYIDTSSVTFNFQDFKNARDAYVKRLNNIYANNLENSKVDHIEGTAQFINNDTVQCGEEKYTADHI